MRGLGSTDRATSLEDLQVEGSGVPGFTDFGLWSLGFKV